MKGFTLIEISLIIIVFLTLSLAFINFRQLNKNFFYIRDVIKDLSVSLNIISDLSQSIREARNESLGNFYYCGYGIYFPNNRSFEVLAFASSTKLCEDSLRYQNNFIEYNLGNKKYVLSNQSITNQVVQGLSLNRTLKEGFIFEFSTSDPNCQTGIITPPLLLLYIYSYSDIFFVFRQGVNLWEKINSDQIFLCVKKDNEIGKIKIGKLGQIILIR